MEIKLVSLDLENFKGVKKFSFKPEGKNALVYGDNGSGKTTLFDAFLWLLFGKDSQEKADFEIKTLEGGQPVHNLEHSVDAVLMVGDKHLNLKKVFKEKYIKKRGSAHAEFTGHTTDYYVDDTPLKKKDWDDRISGIINEENFRLLTSPFYYANLHWKKRRDILLDVCGDVTDEQVMSSEKLSGLPEILNGKSVEDYRATVKSRQDKINDRLKEIPARIDELAKSLPEDESQEDQKLKDQIWKLDRQIAEIRKGSILPKLREAYNKARTQLSELEYQQGQAIEKAERERKKAEQSAVEQHENVSALLKKLSKQEQEVNSRLDELRDKYVALAEENPEQNDKCPSCGQILPADQVESALSHWFEEQRKLMFEVRTQGQDLKKEVEEILKEKVRLMALEESFLKKISELGGDSGYPIPPVLEEEIKKAQDEVDRLGKEIDEYSEPDTAELEDKKLALIAQLNAGQAVAKTRQRIAELGEEEKQLSIKYEQLEKNLYLCEEFIKAKVHLLEGKINSRFELARFKLFETQINEGIKETCEILYAGVPYSKGLNRGAQINVGLDIIKTLSEHWGVKAPIFVDNAESIVNLFNPETQVFSLHVSGEHNQMEVRYE